MARGYASGPFGQIHFYDAEGDGHPLVLWPQAPMTHRQYDAVYARLGEYGIRAIGIDPPGFGCSDPPDGTPEIADWASAIPAVLDTLSLRCVSCAGHHTGALVAAEYAISAADTLDGLIMHGALLPTEEQRARRLFEIDKNERHFEYKVDGGHLTDLFDIRRELSESRISPELLTRYVAEQMIGLGPFWHGHHAAYTYNLEKKLSALPQKTLILSNTGDPMHAQTLLALELEPRLNYVELNGGGVDIIDEQPEAWAEAVANFLRS